MIGAIKMNKVLFGIAVSLCLSSCKENKGSLPVQEQPVKVEIVQPPPPPPPPPPEETFAQKLGKAKTYSDMWKLCSTLPMYKNVDDEINKGALCVSLWASDHFGWTTVHVSKDETSYSLVMKNVEKERGKRLCVRGRLIQISESGNTNEGLLMTPSGKLYNFINVGSSGDITGDSMNERMCGVVIGTYHYRNSGGGVGHAVDMVGMWDIPENKSK